MKKLLLAILFVFCFVASAHAAPGVVIQDNVCGNHIIIQLTEGSYMNSYVGATYYSGTQYKVGDWVRVLVSSPGMRYMSGNYRVDGQYWIYTPEVLLENVKLNLCATL